MDASTTALTLREKQKQQTRIEIIRAAFDLFGKHGFDKVSVEMICEAAGISRATFFNYFPQKELILAEMATARFEKLKVILAAFDASHAPGWDDIVGLFLRLSAENARLGANNRRLLLNTILHQVSQGLLIATKQKAIETLSGVISRIPTSTNAEPRLIAETLFGLYIATTLEWLMQEALPEAWLLDNMKLRLRLALEGIA